MITITSCYRRLAAAIAFVLLLVGPFALGAHTYIYVQTDIGDPLNMNSIAAYSNDGSGNLTPLSGSPYLTGGSGIVAAPGDDAYDAESQVIVNPVGTTLYTVDGHSNDIAAFAINSDGTLSPVRGSPFASGGQDPVSLAISNNLLMVANKDKDPNQTSNGPANYASFSIKANGGLSKRPGSTFDLDDTSFPTQVLMAAVPNTFFGMVEFETSKIGTFAFDSRGVMTQTSSINSPDEGALFLGEVLHPTEQILYAGIVNRKEVAVYTYDAAGVLTFVRLVRSQGSLVCWLRTNAAGTRLYTSESLTRTLSVYDISKPMKPSLLQHVSVQNPDGFLYNIELDPNQKFLYAIVGSQLHVLNVDSSGMLTETAPPVDLPGITSSTQPVGIAVVAK